MQIYHYSVAVDAFAVVAVNTAILQAGIVSRVKLNSIVPWKIAARLDVTRGNFKIEALPVSLPENIAAVQ